MMLAKERRFRIREILSVQRTVNATELTETLGVTTATIRRDLEALEIGKQSFAYVGPATDLDTLITDEETDAAHLKRLRDMGLNVVVGWSTAAARPE